METLNRNLSVEKPRINQLRAAIDQILLSVQRYIIRLCKKTMAWKPNYFQKSHNDYFMDASR